MSRYSVRKPACAAHQPLVDPSAEHRRQLEIEGPSCVVSDLRGKPHQGARRTLSWVVGGVGRPHGTLAVEGRRPDATPISKVQRLQLGVARYLGRDPVADVLPSPEPFTRHGEGWLPARDAPKALRRHAAVPHATQGGDRRCPQSPMPASSTRQSDRSRFNRALGASRIELPTRRFARRSGFDAAVPPS
jgi:hypothetical protein